MIEFAYSTDWRYGIGEWAMILTKSYCRLCASEDCQNGLIFAAEAMGQLQGKRKAGATSTASRLKRITGHWA